MDQTEVPPEYWERQTASNFVTEFYRVKPRATVGLLLLCFLMYLNTAANLTDVSDTLVDVYGAQIGAKIAAGEWWRLVSSMFLHGGLLHIAINGYALWVLGSMLERMYGPGRFLFIYFVSGLAGNLVSYLFLDPQMPSIGASGAIFGLCGAELVLELKKALPVLLRRPLLKGILPWLILNFAIAFAVPVWSHGEILLNNYAHVGGLIGGFATAWFIGTRFKVDPRDADLPGIGGWVLTAFCAVALGMAVYHGVHNDLRFLFKHPF